MQPHLLFVNFHHVRDDNPARFPGFHRVRPAEFVSQIKLLSKRYQFIDPQELVRCVEQGVKLPNDAAVLTFDDGLRDHHDVVMPLLNELRVKGIFFVNSGPWTDQRLLSVHLAHFLAAAFSYPSLADDFERHAAALGVTSTIGDVSHTLARQQYRYDTIDVACIKFFINVIAPRDIREAVLRRVFADRIGDEAACVALHYMNQSEVRSLSENGHLIGLHTHHHLHLASVSSEVRRADLVLNKKYLAEVVGIDHPGLAWISYPYGSPSSFDDAVVDDAQALGCRWGVTLNRGLNAIPPPDRMRLRRLSTNDVEGGSSPIPWDTLLSDMHPGVTS